MAIEQLLITEPDMLRLVDLLETESRWPTVDRPLVGALRGKLARAVVVPEHQIPPDVVTLYSSVRLEDLETGSGTTCLFVGRALASPEAGIVAVLSPLGIALLGRREREEIEDSSLSGQRRLRIERLLFQPEAAQRRRSHRDNEDADGSVRQQPAGVWPHS